MSAAFLSLTIKHLCYVNKVIKTIKNPGVMTRSRGNYRLASMGTSQLKTYWSVDLSRSVSVLKRNAGWQRHGENLVWKTNWTQGKMHYSAKKKNNTSCNDTEMYIDREKAKYNTGEREQVHNDRWTWVCSNLQGFCSMTRITQESNSRCICPRQIAWIHLTKVKYETCCELAVIMSTSLRR